jgi:hypothetical protein
MTFPLFGGIGIFKSKKFKIDQYYDLGNAPIHFLRLDSLYAITNQADQASGHYFGRST